MQNKLKILNEIKEKEFENFTNRLWVIKKSSRRGNNTYRALPAAIEGLNSDFNTALKKFFCGSGDVSEPIRNLSKYSALTVDIDEDRALVHSVGGTDFGSIIEKIGQGADNDPTQTIGDFNNAWSLVVEFQEGQNKLYAFSKIKGGWNLKRKKTVKNWVFSEGHFEKIEAENIFSFRDYFDFVAFGNDVFIRDKANYELGLNIREGLEAKRDVLVDALSKHGIITSVDDLKVAIGTNKTLLRRLVAAEETRYYEDQEFIEDMKGVVNKHDWQLNVDKDGKFIIDENNIDLFLKLINDNRFISLIKKQMVDADSVELVEAATTE